MASKIILKKSSVASKAPVAGDLDFGELAINYTDSKLYFKKADGSIDAFTSATASAPVTSVGGNIGDITDSQLLASVKNVDGAGSGLDADFLDGNHASSFYLASNPNGYTSNTGTVTSVGATSPLVSSGGNTPSISIPAATASANGYMSSAYAAKLDGVAAGATNVTNTNQLTNGAGYITSAALASYLPLSGGTVSGYTTFSADVNMTSANSYLPGHFYTNTHDGSNVYFHVGGTGSITNKILNLRVMNNSGGNSLYQFDVNRLNAPNLQINGNQVLHAGNYTSYRGTQLTSPNGATVVDTDSAMPDSGHSFIHTLAYGPDGNDGHILGMSWASTTSVYGAQLWLDTDPTNRMALRSRNSSGVWNSWSEVLTSSNYSSYALPIVGGSLTTGASNNLFIGRNSTATNYNAISLNGNPADSSNMGLTGGGVGDNTLYINSPGNIVLRTNSFGQSFTINSGGFTGNAATATYATSAGTADQIDSWPFRNTGNNSGTNADTIESNGITYYTAGVTNFSGNASDGALYSQAYSSSWQHQIAGDYRSGQIAVRGKNSGTWQAWRRVLQEDTWLSNKYFGSDGAIYGTIFYDTNNGAYYVDPSSTTSLRTVGSWRSDSSTWDGEFSGKIQYHSNNWYFQAAGEFIWRNSGGSNVIYGDQSGNHWATASSRSPIFYDNNDTGYYVDPNSLSRTVAIAVENRIHITESRFLYMGGTATSENSWGSRDWTAGGYRYFNARGFTFNNEGYGSSYTVNIATNGDLSTTGRVIVGAGQASSWLEMRDTDESTRYLHNNSGTIGFVGSHGSWRFRVADDGNVVMGTYQDWLSNQIRSNIFYDHSDTGYYIDGNSTSSLYRVNINNNILFTNYGRGMIGTYSASRYQAVFAMGDSYKLPDDGTTTGSLYGIAWSHPNAGGVAGNLNTHGALILENGTFLAALSGSIRSRDDMRSPIFYDSNDTGRYLDPNGTSKLGGSQHFVSNRNTSSDTPPLQAFSDNGSGAIMAFHRGGYYAVNFGLDSDNVIRIGGWSAAANRWQLDMSGNGTYAGNVTAYSDERLKKEWKSLAYNFVEELAKVKSGTYTRIDSGERQAGSSAQDWQKLLPEVVTVTNDDDKTLAIAYGNAALVSAVELAKRIVEQDARIALLEERLSKLLDD